MRKLFLLSLAFLLSIYSYSQSREETIASKDAYVNSYSKHRIGLNIGGSTALGEYSEVNESKESSGYAEGGISFSISYQYAFNQNLAITLLYGSSANRFNAQALANQLSFEEPRLNWSVEADPYGVSFGMVGIKGFIGDEIKGYVNPMIGFGTMISPQVNVVASNGVSYVNQRIRESDPSFATLFGFAIGVDFVISKLVSINVDATYLTSEFDIQQELETFNSIGNPILLSSQYDQPYSVLNFSAGIGFHF